MRKLPRWVKKMEYTVYGCYMIGWLSILIAAMIARWTQ